MEKAWYLAMILGALLIAYALGLWAFDSASDVATATGPVITALATVGAAVFGISVGREAGKSEGHEAGTKAGKKELAAEMKPQLHGLAAPGNRDGLAGAAGGGANSAFTRVAALEERLQQIIES